MIDLDHDHRIARSGPAQNGHLGGGPNGRGLQVNQAGFAESLMIFGDSLNGMVGSGLKCNRWDVNSTVVGVSSMLNSPRQPCGGRVA